MTNIFYKISPQTLTHSLFLLHKRRGILSKKKQRSQTVFCILGGIVVATAYFFILTGEENADKNVIGVAITAAAMIFAMFVAIRILLKKEKEKQIKNTARVMYDFGFNTKAARKFTIGEDFLEDMSGYTKTRIAFDEIECVISDKYALTVLLEGEETLISIPKEGQQPELLFEADNKLREIFGERFIYEM